MLLGRTGTLSLERRKTHVFVSIRTNALTHFAVVQEIRKMTYVIVKAEVGYIVRPDYNRNSNIGYSPDESWAAFDTWEQASAWLAKKFEAKK